MKIVLRRHQGTIWYEIRRFIRTKRILFLLAVISFYVIFRGTDAQLIADDRVLRMLFSKTDDEPWKSIFNIIYEFAFVLLTSGLFYIIVDYAPKRKKELKAYKIIAPHLETLFVLQGKLIAFAIFLMGEDYCFPNIPVEIIEKMRGFSIVNETYSCHTEVRCADTDVIVEEANPEYLNGYEHIKELSASIIYTAKNVLSLPVARDVEEDLIDLLTEIVDDRELHSYKNLNEEIIPSGYEFISPHAAEELQKGMIRQFKLFGYPMQHDVTVYAKASQEEIEKARKEYEELKKKFPDHVRFMEEFNSKKS